MSRLLPVLFLMLLSCKHAPVTKTVPEIAQETIPNVVALMDMEGDVFCSGFVVKETSLIATANHCVDAYPDWQVEWEGHLFRVEVLSTDWEQDVALLKPVNFELPPEAGVELATEPPKAGEFVVTVGHALGEHQDTVTLGIVSHPHQVLDYMDYILVDSAILGGMSGGPGLNSEGKAIGIVSFSLVDGTWCPLFVPCEQTYYRSPLHGLALITNLQQLLNNTL